jgi:hypothetical protein
VPERDEFDSQGMKYLTGATPLDEWRSATDWQTVNDRLVNSMQNLLSFAKDVRDKDFWRVINSDYVALFDPFRRYLDGLPPVLKMFFHSNTSFGNMTKDEVLKLSMYGLICCEELDTMKPSEMNRLKWAVTTTVTDERRPYAHYAERRNHITDTC